jgi:phosphatidylserine/phosphatidylglycerophosphate/cardiolipin synthase-like enzyme
VAWINFREYFATFKELLDRKVRLHIICSANRANRSHQLKIDELITLGAKIRLLEMPNTKNHMHHKFVVIDGKSILNDSFNWSPNATRSFENIMLIRDCPEEAHQFIQEFNRLNLIESATIRSLQRRQRCKATKGCPGERFNLLVFSDRSSEYLN